MALTRMIKPWSTVKFSIENDNVFAHVDGVAVKKISVSESVFCGRKQMCVDVRGNVYCNEEYYNLAYMSPWRSKSVSFPSSTHESSLLEDLIFRGNIKRIDGVALWH